MKVYGITTCGSVKKAMSFLKTKGLEFEFVDFKKTKIDSQTLAKWQIQAPMGILFNTKGTKFKTLGLDKNMNDDAKAKWLLDEPMLFKRPVIECDDGSLVVGFDETFYNNKF